MPSTPLSIPETKPATELLDGRLVQKMSPYGLHARVQLAVASALRAWSEAAGRGRVGVEWDFDLTPPGESTNRLVPDVAYVSYDRVPYEDEDAAQVPTVAPNAAVEILSQGQNVENCGRRVQILIACGADLVILIDPRAQEAWMIDASGTRHLAANHSIVHPALPGFELALHRCFEQAPPGGRPA